MAFTAGQKVTALELNRGIPTLTRSTADTQVVSSTALVDAVGVLGAVEADARYWWRLLLAFDSGATPDLKLAWTVPTGTTGYWGIAEDTTRVSAYGDANTLVIDGANTMCVAEGYVDTSSTAGSLQLRFAQNATSATPTIIRANSVLSVLRLPA